MIGSTYYIIGAIALVVLQPITAFDITVASSVCNLLQDGSLIAGTSSCGQYFQCQNGTATARSCGVGSYFSKDQQGCTQSYESSSCGDSISEPCSGIANGTFVSVPGSCSQFYYCNNGVATLGSCSYGLNFDQAQQSCNYTSDFPCGEDSIPYTVALDLCLVIENGVYFGSALSCTGWQICKKNVLSVGSCPSPYYFNVNTGACDYKDDVSCRQVSKNPSAVTDPNYLNGQPCPFSDFVVSDNLTCTGYYSCNNGVYSYASCNGGLYFNPPTQTCINRLNAINNCNRCEDTKLEFVNLYEDGCTRYGYCSNGRVAYTGKCEADSYFDEVAQACVEGEAEPPYAVCNTALSGITTAAPNSSGSTESSGTNATPSGGSGSTESAAPTSSEEAAAPIPSEEPAAPTPSEEAAVPKSSQEAVVSTNTEPNTGTTV